MGVLKAKVGGSWVEIPGVGAGAVDVPWINLTLVNGWLAYAVGREPQYRKIGDIVYLRGVAKTGSSSVMATFPAGYRPVGDRYSFIIHISRASTATAGILNITPNGDLTVVGSVPVDYVYTVGQWDVL